MTLRQSLYGGAAAITLLLGGVALPLMLPAAAAAQASNAEAQIDGVWVASPDGNPATHDVYVQIRDGQSILGWIWQKAASGNQGLAEIKFHRNSGRVIGSAVYEGVAGQREVELVAPPGKSYRLLSPARAGRKRPRPI